MPESQNFRHSGSNCRMLSFILKYIGSQRYHGNRHIINIATKSDLAHLQLDAPQLAQGQLDPRKPLHEFLIELLLQVARLHIFYDTCDVGGERQESTMFAGSQPTIKGVRVVRLGKRLQEELFF